MRAGQGFGLRPPAAFELGPDAREGSERTFVVQREPDHVLFLGLRVTLWCVFGKAVEREQAAALGLQPAAPGRGPLILIADATNRSSTRIHPARRLS
jgi:hypothetical protein